MTAEVTEQTAEIRGVSVRLATVTVAGHTVEQVLSFDVAEAEAVYGRPFDEELDKHIQMVSCPPSTGSPSTGRSAKSPQRPATSSTANASAPPRSNTATR